MQTTSYEIGKDMKLVKIETGMAESLPLGTVLTYGHEHDRICLVHKRTSEYGTTFEGFDMDAPANNANLRHIDARCIKRRDDPGIWHQQHWFVTEETVDAPGVLSMLGIHKQQREAAEKVKAEKLDEHKRLVEEGRRLWARFFPRDCQNVIVAERIRDDSDMQIDYHGETVTETVVLAPSKTDRNSFGEMRNAALLIPETRCLGPGCGCWRIVKKAAQDDPHNRTRDGYYYDPATGADHWTTKGEAQAVLDAALATDAENERKLATGESKGFCPLIPYGYEFEDESIEHRENYSGGKGYYMQARQRSPWRIKKRGVKWDSETILRALAERNDHFEKPQPAPAPAPVPAGNVGLTENTEKGGLEIRFDGKPSAQIIDELKAHGWRWSRFSSCWWIKASDDQRAFAQAITRGEG